MIITRRRASILAVAATTAALLFAPSQAAATDTLNCGDPGTWHNMPVDPNNDPHDLDGNGDGVGCQDASVFGPDGQPVGSTTTTTAPPPPPRAPEPEPVAPQPEPPAAPPAAPVVEEPDYTG